MTTVIIEMREGVLEGVYSNNDISIFVIERHEDEEEDDGPKIAGPYLPTLVKPDVEEAVPDAPNITPELVAERPTEPFFCMPNEGREIKRKKKRKSTTRSRRGASAKR